MSVQLLFLFLVFLKTIHINPSTFKFLKQFHKPSSNAEIYKKLIENILLVKIQFKKQNLSVQMLLNFFF